MADVKYEFGSPDWLSTLQALFESTFGAGSPTDDVAFSLCEVYTDVPARISEETRVAWHMRVTGRDVEFLAGEVDDVDVKVVGEWAVLSMLGRLEYDEAGPPPAAAAEVAKASEEGRFCFTRRPTMRPLPPAFDGLHNQMVRRTF